VRDRVGGVFDNAIIFQARQPRRAELRRAEASKSRGRRASFPMSVISQRDNTVPVLLEIKMIMPAHPRHRPLSLSLSFFARA